MRALPRTRALYPHFVTTQSLCQRSNSTCRCVRLVVNSLIGRMNVRVKSHTARGFAETYKDLLDVARAKREVHRRRARSCASPRLRQKIRQRIRARRLVLWRRVIHSTCVARFFFDFAGMRVRFQFVEKCLARDPENFRSARTISFRFVENAEDVFSFHFRKRLHVLGHETMHARHS